MEYRNLSEMRRILDHSTLKCKSKEELECLLQKANNLLVISKSPQDTSFYSEIETRINSYLRDKEQSKQFKLIVRLTCLTLLISIISLIVSIDSLTSWLK